MHLLLLLASNPALADVGPSCRCASGPAELTGDLLLFVGLMVGSAVLGRLRR